MSTSMGQVTRMGMGQASKETGTYRPGGLQKFFNGYPYGCSTAPETTDEESPIADIAIGLSSLLN